MAIAYLNEWQVFDEAVKHGIEVEDIKENRLPFDECDELKRSPGHWPHLCIPVVKDSCRSSFLVVPVAGETIVKAIIITDPTGTESDRLLTVSTFEGLL